MTCNSPVRFGRWKEVKLPLGGSAASDGSGAEPLRRVRLVLFGLLAFGLVFAPDLWAGGAGTDMPWNTPMQALLNNMTGPTARALVGIATAYAGYKWMFVSHEQGANNMARVAVGGAIALTAQTIISYASFGGALL